MPQIYLKVSNGLESTASADNRKWLKDDSVNTIKENIRERLNLHVKRRIQDQDLLPLPSPQSYTSSTSPIPLLSPASSAPYSIHHPTNSLFPFNHPREYVPGVNSSMPPIPSLQPIPTIQSQLPHPPALIISNNPNKQSSNLHNNVRLMNVTSNETISSRAKQQHQQHQQQLPKRLNGRKKTMTNKQMKNAADAQQNVRFMNHQMELNEQQLAGTPMEQNGGSGGGNGASSVIAANGSTILDDEYGKQSYEKLDSKLSNTPDILSMILSMKKNALMHDPDVIQFILSLR